MQPRFENESLQEKVGENIEHFRLLAKKPVKEMASVLHLSTSGYRNIERGITEISVSKLYLIAVYLNVEIAQLLYFENDFISDKDSLVNNHQMFKIYKAHLQQQKEEICFLRKQLELVNKQNKTKSESKNYFT